MGDRSTSRVRRTPRYRLAALAVAAAVSTAAAPLATPLPALAAAPRPIFGIASNINSLDRAGRDRALNMIQNAGSTWIRGGAYWPYVDRNGRARRDWAATDAFINDAIAHRQTIICSIGGYAAWANGGRGDWYPASDPTEFANFARDAVNRYKDRVHIWEIWSEENGPDFWKPAIDPVAYARMLRASYLAVKQADPTARVAFGGIDRNDYGFLNKVYAALKSYPDAAANHNFFDILAVHPYGDNRPPESDDPAFIWGGQDRNFAGLPKMKAAMEAQGDGYKHVIVTEMGWTVTTCGGRAWASPGRRTTSLAPTRWPKAGRGSTR